MATAAAATVFVAPMAVTPTEAATATSTTVTNAINALAGLAAANDSFYDAVTAARAAYNGLPSTQKSKVTSTTLTKLTNAETAVKVIKGIVALDTDEPQAAAQITTIRNNYYSLPIAGKVLVVNYQDLVAKEQIVADKQADVTAANKVTTQIKALGATPTAAAVAAARTAYDNLDELTQKPLAAAAVSILEAAEQYLLDLDAAVIKLNDYVNKVNLIQNASNRVTALNNANAAYLTSAEIALLPTAKKTELSNAKKIYDEYAAAQVVITQISALTLGADFTAYTNDVKAARTAYNALPLAQKVLVTNVQALLNHEQTVAQGPAVTNPYEAAIDEVEIAITALPEAGSAGTGDISAISIANGLYTALPAAAKPLVNQQLVTKLNNLLAADIYPNASSVEAFESQIADLKTRSAGTIAIYIQQLEAAYAQLTPGVKTVVDTKGNYAKVLLAKPIINAINEAVAGVPTGNELTVANSALAALSAAEGTYNAATLEVKAYVRNYSSLTTKITNTKAVLKSNATTAISQIPFINSTTSTALATKIADAETALAKYGLVFGVDFTTATDAQKAIVTNTITTQYADLLLAKAALPVVQKVAALNYIHPSSGTVDLAVLNSAIDKYVEEVAPLVTAAMNENKYFVNKDKLTGLDKTAIERSLTALAAAADTAITNIASVTNKTPVGLEEAISNAETAANNYANANKKYKGETDLDYSAVTKYADINNANAAKTTVGLIHALVPYATNPATALTKNKEARDSYAALSAANAAALPYVVNYSKLLLNEAAASNALEGLKATADLAISNLVGNSSKGDLADDITAANNAVGDYKSAYNNLYGTTPDATIFGTLINHNDIALAQATVDSGAIEAVAALTAPFTAAQITNFVTAKTKVEGLTTDKFLVNKALYTTVSGQVTTMVGNLKTTANNKIAALDTATTKAQLDTAISEANPAVLAYTDIAAPLNGGDVAAAKATLTNAGNIALAEAAVHATTGIVTKVAALPVYTDGTLDAAKLSALEAAINAYKALKPTVDALTADEKKYFVNKSVFTDLKTEIEKSITSLKGTANAAIEALEDDATTTTAAELDTAIDDAKDAVDKFKAHYVNLNGGSDSDAFGQLTNYNNIALAEAALPVVEAIEALSYTHPANNNVDLTALNNAIIAHKAVKLSIQGLGNNVFIDNLSDNYDDVTDAIEDSIDALTAKANTALDAIVPAANSTALEANIAAAETAVTNYRTAYVYYHKAVTDAEATVVEAALGALTNYKNIADARAAKPVVVAVEQLNYVHPTSGSVDPVALNSAISAYHAALSAASLLTHDQKVFFINKASIETADGAAKKALTDSIAALATEADTAIGKFTTPAPADAATLNTLIAAAETAVSNYETADKAFKKAATANLVPVTNYANLAKAKAAVSVGVTMEVALGSVDDASTKTVHERLVKLLAAKAAHDSLDSNAFLANIYSNLSGAIADIQVPFGERVTLLDTANNKVIALQQNTSATDLATKISEAKAAVDAYVAKTIPDTATPLAADVTGYADIALYEAAKPTIEAIAAIASAADKAQAVAAAKALFTPLQNDVKTKVFNSAALTAAEQEVADTAAQAKADKKQAAEAAITAIKSKTTVADFVSQIGLAEAAVAEYTALSTSYSVIDIANFDDLEYAKEAQATIQAIDGLASDAPQAAIDSVKDQYNAISAQAKTFVFNSSKLTGIETNNNTAAQGNVVTLVDNLATVAITNLVASIEAAETAYNALTDAQKLAIADQKIVEKLNNYKAAAPVIVGIADLNYADWTSTNVTPANVPTIEAKFTAIRTVYSRLPIAQKVLVRNYQDLVAAEAKLVQIKDAHLKAADQLIADVVIEQIAALDELTEGTAQYEAAVKAARKAYNALAIKHKVLVTNIQDLISHEQNI